MASLLGASTSAAAHIQAGLQPEVMAAYQAAWYEAHTSGGGPVHTIACVWLFVLFLLVLCSSWHRQGAAADAAIASYHVVYQGILLCHTC
jgi:hypothetical protein